MNYRSLLKRESYGVYGGFGIEILISSALPEITADPILSAAYDAADAIEAEVMADVIASNPENLLRAARDRDQLVALFPGRIFVEEIPNGYCNRWCCRHLPWFIVTTTVGRFKIGWRKRVIHLEWSEVVHRKPAAELFPNEDVTKGEFYIHAWSLEKAQSYVEKIIGGAK